MRGYTAKIAIENYLLTNIDSSFDTQIDTWIEAVEKYIENYTGRIFIADTEATEKKYDGDGEDTIFVDDFISLISVYLGTTLLDSETDDPDDPDYYQYPANTEYKNKLEVIGGVFSEGHKNVKITAKWGYSATVPEDIKHAATIIVAGIINASNKSVKSVRSETTGRYTIQYSNEKGWNDYAEAIKILNLYRKLVI